MNKKIKYITQNSFFNYNFNSIPNDKNLEWSKLKAFADDNLTFLQTTTEMKAFAEDELNLTKMTISLFDTV